MTKCGRTSAFIIALAVLTAVAGAARPSAAEDGDMENAATIDLVLTEAAAVRSTPEARGAVVGTLPAGGVATVVWAGRRQDTAGVVWVRVSAPFDGWLPAGAVGISSVSLNPTPGLPYSTTQLPLTGSGSFLGSLPTPATIGAP